MLTYPQTDCEVDLRLTGPWQAPEGFPAGPVFVSRISGGVRCGGAKWESTWESHVGELCGAVIWEGVWGGHQSTVRRQTPLPAGGNSATTVCRAALASPPSVRWRRRTHSARGHESMVHVIELVFQKGGMRLVLVTVNFIGPSIRSTSAASVR